MSLVVVGGHGDDAWMGQPGVKWVWTDAKGGPKLVPGALQNALSMLEYHPSVVGMFRHDQWRDAMMMMHGLPGDDREIYPRDITDADEVAVAGWLSTMRLTAPIRVVGEVIREIALRNGSNPMLIWLGGLKWDGKDRLDDWLTTYAGVEANAYARLVARRFMVSAIARAIKPGVKCDTMLILEGPQGLKKSSLVAALAPAPEYFSDQIGEITSKEGSQLIQGYWIIEVPEMNNMSRHEASAVKEFISRQSDRYRPPYGRNVIVRGRRCVFVGTINPDGNGYLKDPTGARRFWPVICTKIDLEGLILVRDQLWAEALSAYQTDERWWVDEDESDVVSAEQADRIDEDVWEGPVVAHVALKYSGDTFTSGEVLSHLGVETRHQEQKHKIRVAHILKRMGCNQRVVREGDGVSRKWVRP